MKKVPFQKTRILWFAFKHAVAHQRTSGIESDTHKMLTELAILAIKHIENDTVADFHVFVADLDKSRTTMLDDMLAGTHKDVPPWLQK